MRALTVRGRSSVHLMADSDEELIAYAVRIGMQRSWVQHCGRWDCHFDVTGARLARVLRDHRVVKLDRRAMVERWKAKRAAGGVLVIEGGDGEYVRDPANAAGTAAVDLIPDEQKRSAAEQCVSAAEQFDLFGMEAT